MKETILIVDDEHGIVDMMCAYFSPQYEVLTAYSVEEALQKVEKQPDLILLDINMPGINGLTVCQTIREHIACPILFLTARIESADKINGFKQGPMTISYSPLTWTSWRQELPHICEGSNGGTANPRCAFSVNFRWITLPELFAIHGELVTLSKREFDILELLSLNAGQVFDRERIYETVWGIDGDGNSDTVMEHIRKIRAKLAAHTLRSYIETVWGCGYKWNA